MRDGESDNVQHPNLTRRIAKQTDEHCNGSISALQIDLEQELRYESILQTKRRLQENDLVSYRQQIDDVAQQKLLVYTKIEEENQTRIRSEKWRRMR